MVEEEISPTDLNSSHSSSYFFIFITLIFFVIFIVYFSRKSKQKPKEKTDAVPLGANLDNFSIVNFYESAKESINTFIGKTILYMNMRGDAIVYNYPFEKGFIEKVFDNVTMPRTM
jgi:hypothetical protein